MSKKSIAWILLAWIIGCSAHAWYYVSTILSHPGLEGYERDWSFQLTMFLIFRFPIWLVGLFLVFGSALMYKAIRD